MIARAVAFLLDPGPPGRTGFVLRLVLAAVFIGVGMGKFVNHDAYVDRFDRWGFGFAPGTVAILVGLLEVAGGLALAFGVVPRAVAVVLACNMVGALATAGRIDGGQDIWLPLVLIALLAVIVVRGGGTPRLELPYPGSSDISRRRPKVR